MPNDVRPITFGDGPFFFEEGCVDSDTLFGTYHSDKIRY